VRALTLKRRLRLRRFSALRMCFLADAELANVQSSEMCKMWELVGTLGTQEVKNPTSHKSNYFFIPVQNAPSILSQVQEKGEF
jgi:hypothetical protein